MPSSTNTFSARGIVVRIQTNQSIVIQHDAISNFMPAMTMPFQAMQKTDLDGLVPGDQVSFRLTVTPTESWIDHIKKTGVREPVPAEIPVSAAPIPTAAILDYRFTNELGEAVSLNDFHGQALAITFFYTRCPLPEFCPRLSKNFEMTQQTIESMTNALANWHLISVTFDPDVDTPDRLQRYGQSYLYDPKHWSFLTGPADKIAELARAAGVEYAPDAGTINHNFRTLIIDADGHLQTVFPTGGDLSGQITAELLKAAAVTAPPAPASQK